MSCFRRYFGSYTKIMLTVIAMGVSCTNASEQLGCTENCSVNSRSVDIAHNTSSRKRMKTADQSLVAETCSKFVDSFLTAKMYEISCLHFVRVDEENARRR